MTTRTKQGKDLGCNALLGDMLRDAREQRGWSLSEAAGMLGCAKAHLWEMETYASDNPTLRTLAAFVVVYGLRPEALIATAVRQPAMPVRKPKDIAPQLDGEIARQMAKASS